MSVKPVLQALVLADHIYIDSNTGKKIIAGTFNQLNAHEFPTDFGAPLYVFLSMTDVHGSAKVELRFVDLSSEEIQMAMSDLVIQAPNPLDTVELVVEVPSLPMPHPGVFSFEVWVGNDLIGSLRVSIIEIEDDHDHEH